jgi:hypothetical protein
MDTNFVKKWSRYLNVISQIPPDSFKRSKFKRPVKIRNGPKQTFRYFRIKWTQILFKN